LIDARLGTATGFVGRRYGTEGRWEDWEGVITTIFKESQLKFPDTEKEPSPPIDYLISSIPSGDIWGIITVNLKLLKVHDTSKPLIELAPLA